LKLSRRLVRAPFVAHELKHVSAAVLLSDPPPERKRGAGMSLNEARYLQKLVEKHGDDVPAMARDHKLNYDQKSPGQLKKRLAIYRSIYGEQKEAIPVFLEQPRGRLPFRYIDPRVVTRAWGRRKPPRAERHSADVVSRPQAAKTSS
jgi:hypothetical protein